MGHERLFRGSEAKGYEAEQLWISHPPRFTRVVDCRTEGATPRILCVITIASRPEAGAVILTGITFIG
jgi:hypothetical protein